MTPGAPANARRVLETSPLLIAIAGGSGTGKSSLAAALVAALPGGDALRLELDSYYRDQSHLPAPERGRINFDEPPALDEGLLVAQIRDLARGRSIRRPSYDFAAHRRRGDGELLEPRSFVVVEGLFALYWAELRALCGVKVFVEAPHETCRERRERRDVTERGRTPESARRQYDETVRPMYERHVRPTRAHADLVLSGEAALEESTRLVLEHAMMVVR